MSSIDTLAQKIKAKHPQYNDMDNLELVQKIIAKHPQYSDMLDEGDRNILSNLSSMNGKGPLDDLMGMSKNIGNMVKGGAAGIADIDAALLPRAANMIPGVNMEEPSIPDAVLQAGQDVQNVTAGKPAETAAGRAGEFAGSFFTPNQIALQALGGTVAKPIAAGVGKMTAATLRGLSSVVPEFAGKLAGVVGAEPGAVAALAENPEAVSKAGSMVEAAKDTGSFLKGIGQRGQKLAQGAKALLSSEAEVKGAVNAAQSGLAKLTSADIGTPLVKDTLSNVITDLGKDSSEKGVQAALDKLDDVIKYNSKNPSDSIKVLKNVRNTLSEMLKAQNPAYETGIEASAATRGPMTTLEQNLGVQKGLPGDWTINALKKVNNPEALATQRALAALPGGVQLAGNVANSSAKAALQRGLLGKLALWLAPRMNNLVQGGVQALPATGNAVAQGLE